MKTNVLIFGPNLRDQSKGQFHVHAADCRDCKNYGPGSRYGGEVLKLDAVSKDAYAPSLGTFATGSKLKLGPVVEFKSNVFLRLDAVTGERLFSTTFKHVDRPSWQRGIYPSSSFTIGKDKDTSERIGNVGELDLHGSLDSDTNRFDAKTMEGI